MYSVKETALKLKVSTRAVQKRCKRDNIRKKDNKYLITDEHINKWTLEIQSNEPQTNQSNEPQKTVRTNNQLDIEIEALKKEITELKEELSTYEITENERIEVFTNEEYNLFQERLIEWRTQQKDSEHQQELFDAKILTLEQSADHYKNSYYYQRKQNEKFINMHEKLLDTIQLNSKEGFIKTVVEAKNTDWTKE